MPHLSRSLSYHQIKQLPKTDSNGVYYWHMIIRNEYHYIHKNQKDSIHSNVWKKTSLSNGLYVIWWTTIICTVSTASKVVPAFFADEVDIFTSTIILFVWETRLIGSNQSSTIHSFNTVKGLNERMSYDKSMIYIRKHSSEIEEWLA